MVKSDIDIDPRGPPFLRDDVEIAQIRRSMKKWFSEKIAAVGKNSNNGCL